MRILLVDDSALIRGILRDLLQQTGDNQIEEASNGRLAVEKNLIFKPDLIIMDINMPIMNGLEATAEIMKSRPIPILILSNELDAYNSFKAFNNGALDVLKKPDLYALNDPDFSSIFIERIGLLARAKFNMTGLEEPNGALAGGQSLAFKVLVVGASAGGPLAVKEVLSALPPAFPLGIVLVQHLEAGFDKSFALWLASETKLAVRVAKNENELKAGEVLIAPVGRHLVFKNQRLCWNDGPKVLNQKPSIDVLFNSAAEAFGERALGLLLTGMGSDGAQGCLNIKRRGGFTIVQDPATCAVYGMPKAAIELQAATRILPLDKLAPFILKLVGLKQDRPVAGTNS